MSPIQRVLRGAARRLLVNDLLTRLVVCATAAGLGLAGTLIVQRVFGLTLPWRAIVLGAAGGSVLVALVWTIMARRSRLAVARVVDERAQLRESISTTLTLGDRHDPWSDAVRQTAQQRAAQVRVREAIPIERPRFWPAPIAAVLAIAILWWAMPELDVFGRGARRAAQDQQHAEVRQVRQDIEAKQRALDDLLSKAGLESGDLADPLEAQPPADRATPEDLRRAAVKRLTNLADELQRQSSGDKAKRMDALQRQLRQLRQPGPGPMDALARKLAQGKMAQARKELDSIAKQLSEGTLSPEQRDQLKQQLDSLGKQMQDIAQQQHDAAQQQMEQMGLSREQIKQLMSDPKQLEQMLDQLSPEQQDQLKELAQRLAASQDMGSMGEQMQQMSKGQLGEGMGELGEMLSEFEMMQADLEAMDAAMAETLAQLDELGGQMGQGEGPGPMMGGKPDIGEWREGESDQPGMGSGGPGKGKGASIGDTASDFTLRKARSKSHNQAGPIIARSLIDGPQTVGESHATLADAVAQAQQRASEAIDTMVIHRELQDAVKSYFSALERTSSAAPAKDKPSDTPPTEPEDG